MNLRYILFYFRQFDFANFSEVLTETRQRHQYFIAKIVLDKAHSEPSEGSLQYQGAFHQDARRPEINGERYSIAINAGSAVSEDEKDSTIVTRAPCATASS